MCLGGEILKQKGSADMVEWLKILFDGFGTSIILLVISNIITGITSYKKGIKKGKLIQVQSVGKGAQQIQVANFKGSDRDDVVKQTQKAGNAAEQRQQAGTGDF